MRIYLALSIFFYGLGILNPIHNKPYPSFFSEIFIFLSLIFLFLINKKNRVPLNFALIFLFYTGFFLITNFLISNNGEIEFYLIYIFSFIASLTISYSMVKEGDIQNLFNITAKVFIFLGLISSIYAISQWLNLEIKYLTNNLIGLRPYANFAQPNHLSTFLLLSLISVFYIYEKSNRNNFFLFMILIILMFGIVLTQSRTAWVIMFFIPIMVVFKSKKIILKLTKCYMLCIFFLFWMLVISLPYINDLLNSRFNIIKINGISERVTSGYLRFDIWNQMIHAIKDKPWLGYGLGQTTSAQYAVIDTYHGREWISSSHNIILDILVWCGLPLGLILILYFGRMFWLFVLKSKSIETLCSGLMISIMLIHAMLEYPLNYAYFLLPFGFLCGISLSEQKIKTIEISNKYGYLATIIGLLIVVQVFKEYAQITDNIVAANTHEMNELKTEIELPYESFFFDKYEDRARWIAQYPYMEVNQNVLDLAERNLNSFLTPYDLYKYSILLAHNGHKEMAERQLKILKVMYGIDHSYESLFIKTQSVEIPSEN
ncbi:O-antigen ligase family protein [Acinetobacter sp. YH16032]|uniref:O-antigen ligase family protein n=1 Tax=Acinetobacter sp. YH16032 TaxID=2601181 RepID=UPI0015D0DAF2|nr:O-antigen ligase family protein [Acinetobacter sp. YH16032]